MHVPFNQQLVTTGDLTTVNDPAVMSIQALAAGLVSYQAQALGVIMEMDNRQATINPTALLGGWYQYVQFINVTSIAAGCLCFWDTFANSGHTKYAVTTTATSTNIMTVAGVVLNGSMTLNNFGWIQIMGLANVLYKTTPTDTTVDDVVFSNVAPANTVDANTPAAVTAAQLAKAIGTAYQTPVTAVQKIVALKWGGALMYNE